MRYGSIAWDEAAVKWGMAWRYDSQREADAKAIEECVADGGRACKIVMPFWNTCAAVAEATNGVRAWDRSDSRNAAKRNAVAQCVGRGGTGCKVKDADAVCSR